MSRALARVLVAFFLALPAGSVTAQEATPSAAEGSSRSELVDLNTATEVDLMSLPGVGPARAKAIIAFRESHGGFLSVTQLLRVKGFGRATFKRLRPLLRVSVR